MSIIIESSRPKVLVLSSAGALDSGTNATIVNGDESLPKSMEDLDASIEEPPAQKLVLMDVVDDIPEKEANGTAQEEAVPAVNPDVEMENLSGASAEIPVPSRSSLETDVQIKHLQAQLLREETKLALMKRIYQLQNQPVKQEKREEATGTERKGQHNKLAASVVVQQNGVKSNKTQPDGMTGKGDKQYLRDVKKPNLAKSGMAANQRAPPGPAGIGAAVAELSRSLAQKTQPVLKYQQNSAASQGYGHAVQNSRAQPAPPPPPPQKPQQHPVEALEQQFSSDRIALRRQMEKSILQIVPPKPPLPDINFIPTTICPDFIALLGMELSANYAINGKNLIDQSTYVEPHQCLKCGEDVCPMWKIDAENSPFVVCESCYYSARSAVSRMSHLETLKRSFADILEKEKELERQHAAAMEKAKATAPPRTANKPSAPLAPVYPTNATVRSQVAAIVNNHHGSSNNNTHHLMRNTAKQRNSFYDQSPSQPHSQSLRPSALPPAPPARSSSKPPISSPYAPMAAPLPYAPTTSSRQHGYASNNMPHGMRQSADVQSVQRQYLLDMISRAPKQQAPAGNGNWRKTTG